MLAVVGSEVWFHFPFFWALGQLPCLCPHFCHGARCFPLSHGDLRFSTVFATCLRPFEVSTSHLPASVQMFPWAIMWLPFFSTCFSCHAEVCLNRLSRCRIVVFVLYLLLSIFLLQFLPASFSCRLVESFFVFLTFLLVLVLAR